MWVLVEPIAHLVVPVLIFGFLRQRMVPGVEYPVFIVYGFMPFVLFKGICLQVIDGVNSSQGLLSYRQVHLIDVFVAKTIALCAVQAVVFAIVLTGLAMLGYDVLPRRPVELSGVLLLTVLVAFGLGLLFAAIASVIPDTRAFIKILFMPLYFVSGILFPVTRFPDDWVEAMSINPLLHLVELTRLEGLEGYVPMRHLKPEYPLVLALATIVIGLMLYRLRYLAKVTG